MQLTAITRFATQFRKKKKTPSPSRLLPVRKPRASRCFHSQGQKKQLEFSNFTICVLLPRHRAPRTSPHFHSQCQSLREHGDAWVVSLDRGHLSRIPPTTSDTRPLTTRTEKALTLVVEGWMWWTQILLARDERNYHHSSMSVHVLRHASDEEGEQQHDRQPPELDADPPRQRRTRWLEGPASVRKGTFCATNITASHELQRTQTNDRRGRCMHEGRDQKTLSANTAFEKYDGLPVLGLVPTSSWVGRPPVFGMVARPVRLSLPGVGMLRCNVTQATVVLPQASKDTYDQKHLWLDSDTLNTTAFRHTLGTGHHGLKSLCWEKRHAQRGGDIAISPRPRRGQGRLNSPRRPG